MKIIYEQTSPLTAEQILSQTGLELTAGPTMLNPSQVTFELDDKTPPEAFEPLDEAWAAEGYVRIEPPPK